MAVNNAWADAIGKVLHSEPKCKSVVLAKAKKDKDRNLKRPNDAQEDVQIVKADGTVVDVQDKTDNKSDNTRPKKRAKLSRHEWDVLGKTKPKPEDNDRERMLCAIATKGVVQLFNAVREQQTTIESKIKEVGTSETKREKAMSQFDKKQFLDKLKGRNDKNENKKSDQSEDKSTEQKWKVLRNDFMIGAKMKDWDKDSDSEEE